MTYAQFIFWAKDKTEWTLCDYYCT